jgi:hypothetical protein
VKILSTDQIQEILGRASFEQFVGAAEDQLLEAKGYQGWDLNSHAGRFELAKDVSSFANATGGYIVVGLATQRLTNQIADEVGIVQMVEQTAFDIKKVAGVIREYVWPPLDNVTVEWLASSTNSQMGLGVVHIPPQDEDKKWFVMTKSVFEGEQLKEMVVGIAVRRGANSIPLTGKQVYDAIQKGRDPVLQRSLRIEEKLDALLARSSAPTVTGQAVTKLTKRIRNLVDGSNG